MKRTVPLIITFLIGSLLIISTFLPPLEGLSEDFTLFFDIIAVFAFFLGGGNLVRLHFKKLAGKKEDWQYSIVTLVGFFLMLIAGLFKIGNPGNIATSVTTEGTLFQLLYQSIFVPAGATMYALLGFFVASASYRAFRAKNLNSTILLAAAFIILLGRTPLGAMATGWISDSFSVLQVPNLAAFIMNSFNMAGQRAIMIGICLGVVSISLRIILGIERTHLGVDND